MMSYRQAAAYVWCNMQPTWTVRRYDRHTCHTDRQTDRRAARQRTKHPTA